MSCWIVNRLESEKITKHDTQAEAQRVAEQFVGNRSAANPAPGLFLYGPGDGTTTCIVRRTSHYDVDQPIQKDAG